MRTCPILLAAAVSLGLGGCSPVGLAVTAASALARAADRPRPAVVEDRRPAARAACEAEAGRHGQVHIIDAEQRPDGRVTVWGRVEDDAGQRRAFECRFDRGEVKAFRLRDIASPSGG